MSDMKTTELMHFISSPKTFLYTTHSLPSEQKKAECLMLQYHFIKV